MRLSAVSTLVAVVLIIWAVVEYGTHARAGPEDNAPKESIDARPFAVVELFTSEGCSSCPPADELLTELAEKYAGKPQRVFPLSLHVDYWDRLGWKDPYGSPEHSVRQRAYGTAFRSDNVYTPQAVVNGTEEFVGSDRKRMAAAVERALSAEAKTRVTLEVGNRNEPKTIAVRYSVTPVPRDCVLHVALVERNLVSDVPWGENGGRQLRHDNVVRALQTFRLTADGRGDAELTLSENAVRPNVWIVAYAQNRKTMAIVGAAGSDLPGNKPGVAPAH